jgi:2-dehydropantoate 2-reductase
MEAFTIVGAGGIGCAVGYALHAAGASVTFVDASPAKVSWGQRNGVCLDRLPPLRATFQHFEDWTPAPRDTVLLCTKCYDNASVLVRLTQGIALIPIQNGFDPLLEPWLDSGEGIASFVSECDSERTDTRITRRGTLHLGGRGGQHRGEPLSALAALLGRSGFFRVEPVSDILPYKHTKLMYNAAIGPLAAAGGLDNGQLLAFATARRLFFSLLRENYAILQGAGVPLGRIGPFRPDTVARILQHRWIARALSWAFYPSLRGTYCSMNADLPRGRTEIDYYNRYLIDLAGDRPCPLNCFVYDFIKRMEKDRLPPDLTRLEEMAGHCSLSGVS